MENIKPQYKNRVYEMARKNLMLSEMSKMVHMNRDTLSRKLSRKSPIFLDEAYKIQKTCFPETEVEKLFQELTTHIAQ